MLNASVPVQNALNDLETVLYLTIQIDWPSAAGGTERLTDYHADVVIGSQTFRASGGLLSYSRPAARSVISRNQFSVELENNDSSRTSQVEAAPSGVPISVFLNFEDPANGSRIGELEIYSGISTSAQITTNDTGQVARVDFSGQLVNLEEVAGRFTTPSSQQAFDSTDSSMDYAHDPDGELVLLWGRE